MSPYLGHVWNGEFLCQMTISKLFMSGLMLFWGRVGKLSIKVPWKKFGWEPIIIALEDVFICLCQREDSEWSSDSMERRELAGKMAKLNAIELAKFSRRVSDNPAGQSFLSYIYAKALDNIQVSIRNVHIIYSDSHNDLGKFIFGLRFSTLTIMTDTRKKNSTLPIIGKSRSAQVNKIVEISDVGLYCNLLEGSLHSLIHTIESQLLCDERCDYLINPFDVSVSLVVNKSGKLDGSPQYAIITELTTLVVSLNEILLEQILGLCDNLSICKLRENVVSNFMADPRIAYWETTCILSYLKSLLGKELRCTLTLGTAELLVLPMVMGQGRSNVLCFD